MHYYVNLSKCILVLVVKILQGCKTIKIQYMYLYLFLNKQSNNTEKKIWGTSRGFNRIEFLSNAINLRPIFWIVPSRAEKVMKDEYLTWIGAHLSKLPENTGSQCVLLPYQLKSKYNWCIGIKEETCFRT